MVVDPEPLVILVQRTQFPQEWKVFSRILEKSSLAAEYTRCLDVNPTFWACWAIISTNEKSYIPNAVSKRRSASTKNIIYFTASSTNSGSVSVSSRAISERFINQRSNNSANLVGEVREPAQPHDPMVFWPHKLSRSNSHILLDPSLPAQPWSHRTTWWWFRVVGSHA